MADDQTPKKVVKRVVTKPAGSGSGVKPTVRYGRPVGGTASAPSTARAPKATVARAPKKSKKTRKQVDVTTEVGAGTTLIDHEHSPVKQPKQRAPKPPRRPARDRISAAGGGISDALFHVREALVAAFWWVVDGIRSLRLPRWDPVPASLLTGVITGLASVLLGLVALQVFDWLRGVASGGGTWGTLTFVVVGFVAFVIGELMLSGFGVSSPRLTSFLGVVITIVAILGLFLDESDTKMAIVVVPAVAATAFTLAHWLMAAAEAGAQSEE